jgi:hypothetical protein
LATSRLGQTVELTYLLVMGANRVIRGRRVGWVALWRSDYFMLIWLFRPDDGRIDTFPNPT